MSIVRKKVELLEKNKPRQQRAVRTYENILVAAAQLLVEVGVERISTNLIAERARIAVPALYRYFPNKYSVLHALGATLMDRQNQVCQKWLEDNLGNTLEAEDIYCLLRETYDVTTAQLGGLEIIQSLRAVGPLQDVRLTSHRLVAQQFAAMLCEFSGFEDTAALSLRARVSIDLGYAVVEMALEDESLSAESVLREGAQMIHLYWQQFFD
ncbi:MAG: TetR/AcrR family transcriptional regulator [Halieaceae bacterium]|jgi:AcrR family transcriptional regulator|nr:TetR/AcrR family transcriptional regulator [Halieaceae bacterium]